MRKKLVVLLCVLMALSTVMFAVSMVSTGANASFDYYNWTFTYDELAPNVGDSRNITGRTYLDGNSAVGSITRRTSATTLTAMNTAADGAFMRATSTGTSDTTLVNYTRSTHAIIPGVKYRVRVVVRVPDDVVHVNDENKRLQIRVYRTSSDYTTKNFWSEYEAAEADANGWKTVDFDYTANVDSPTTAIWIFAYFTSGYYFDVKSLSFSTPVTMPSVTDPIIGLASSKIDFESYAHNKAIGTSQTAIPANDLPAEIGGGFKSTLRYAGASWKVINGDGADDAYAQGTPAGENGERLVIYFNEAIPNNTTYTVTVKLRLRNADGSAYDPEGTNTVEFYQEYMVLRLRNGTTNKQSYEFWDDFMAATPDATGFVTLSTELTTGADDNCNDILICAYIKEGLSCYFDVGEVTISADVVIPSKPIAGERIIDFTAYNDVLTDEGDFVNVPTTEKGHVVVDTASAGAKVGLEGADQYYFLRLGADADAASVAVKLNIAFAYGQYNLKMKVRPSADYVEETEAYLRFYNERAEVEYISGDATGYYSKMSITSYIDALTVNTWTQITIPFSPITGVNITYIELTFANGNSATNYIDIDEIYLEQTSCIGYGILGNADTIATALTGAQSGVYVTGSAIALDNLGINALENTTVTNLAAVGGYDYTTVGTHKVAVTLTADSGYRFFVGTGEELVESTVITVEADFVLNYAVLFKHNGAVLSSLISNADGYVLPDASIGANKYLLGWYGEVAGDDVFLPAGYNLTSIGALSENLELEGLFATINTLTGASVKFGDVRTGLRFETEYELENTDFATNVEMYTLLSPKDYVDKATDFTKAALETANEGVDGAIYLEVMSNTINTSDNGLYEYYSASYVNIKPYNYARQISARGFLKVTYSDDSEGIIYGTFDAVNNSRSVYEVAIAAYKDRATAEDDVYKYEPDDIDETTYYSRYTAEQLAILKMYIDGVVNIELSGDDYVPVNPLGDTGYNKYVAPYTVTFEDGVITLADNGEVEGDWTYYTSMRGSYYRASVIIDGERKTKRSEDFTVSVDETMTVGDIVNTITKN